MRASTVADLFSIDKGAISRQVTHLIELGLIEKSRDPEDGRAWLLTATPDALEDAEPDQIQTLGAPPPHAQHMLSEEKSSSS